jgi:hypothetical protein
MDPITKTSLSVRLSVRLSVTRLYLKSRARQLKFSQIMYFYCGYKNKYKKENKINIKGRSHTINAVFFAVYIDNCTEPFLRESDSHMAGFIFFTSHARKVWPFW